MPAVPVTSDVDRKINVAVSRGARHCSARRRWQFGLAVACAMGLGIVLYPSAKAYALLSSVSGKLDNVKSVQISRYRVAQGARVLEGSIDYLDGDWVISQQGKRDVYRKGKYYRYEPSENCYVVDERPNGPFQYNSSSFKLSSLLNTSGGSLLPSPVKMSEKTENGRPMLVATIDNPQMSERVVITADKESELPIRTVVLQLSNGSYTEVGEMRFDYSPAFSKTHFELKNGIPMLSQEQFATRSVARATANDLGSHALRKGRIVIRSLDVARDGTVFVTYQAGDKTNTRWRGFGLKVSDSLGTKYIEPRDCFNQRAEFAETSPAGNLELEVWIPTKPRESWQPVTVDVSIALTSTNELMRFIDGFEAGERHVLSNGPGKVDMSKRMFADQKFLPISKKMFSLPSCEWRPEVFAQMNESWFSDEGHSRMFRADRICQYFQGEGQFDTARKWAMEAIRVRKSIGYGTTHADRTLAAIDRGEKYVRGN